MASLILYGLSLKSVHATAEFFDKTLGYLSKSMLYVIKLSSDVFTSRLLQKKVYMKGFDLA